MSELLNPDAARRRVVERAWPLPVEAVDLGSALGRTLAQNVAAESDVPGFDNSAMDGYAIKSSDVIGATSSSPVWLSVVGESRAGHPAAARVGQTEAVAISTGAQLPAGSDAVVRVEETRSEANRVAVLTGVAAGANVRRAGDDLRSGELALPAGTRLGAAELAVAAAVGAAQLPCHRRPRVAIVATGDELISTPGPLGPGQVRNTNGPAIAALAFEQQAEIVLQEAIGDDRAATERALERALDADLTVVSGGVSVGRHDHVKPALQALGAQQVFWGVALRPGKPTWFGSVESKLVFGLPGNPVSAMITFHLFVRPALASLQGREVERHTLSAIFDAEYPKRPGRTHVLRCRAQERNGALHVQPTKDQGSHVLSSMLATEALAYIEAERGDIARGDTVSIELMPTYFD